MGKGLQRTASVMETLQRVLISVSGAVRYGALGPDLFLLWTLGSTEDSGNWGCSTGHRWIQVQLALETLQILGQGRQRGPDVSRCRCSSSLWLGPIVSQVAQDSQVAQAGAAQGHRTCSQQQALCPCECPQQLGLLRGLSNFGGWGSTGHLVTTRRLSAIQCKQH